jgi:starvation-inducible DNA-binding protein
MVRRIKIEKGEHQFEREQVMASVTADLEGPGGAEISDALRHLLADVFTVFMKTKGFHWHIGGRHFRDYHLLLDEQASRIFAMVDEIAEPARKLGGGTLRSVSEITRNQRLRDNDDGRLSPADMLKELLDDNRQLTRFLRSTHELCDRHRDVATASLLENWIDEAERRIWFLAEITHDG